MKKILFVIFALVTSMKALAAIDVYIDRIEPERFVPKTGEECRIWVTIMEDAARLDIEIRDYSNNVVYSRMFTNQLRGAQSYQWDGRDSAKQILPAGDYRIEVIARDAAGNSATDFHYLIISEEEKEREIQRIPELPELTPPALRPTGYFRSVGRYADGEDAYYEHRAQLQLDYNKENLKIYARGDLRKATDSDWENDNSEFGMTWSTKVFDLQLAMRDQLGRFEDPLQLYSDYTMGRKSYGLAVTSKFEGINFNIIHSRQEGSKSNSTAMRLTAELFKDLSLSGNWVLSIDEQGDDSSAYSLDASWRISNAIDFTGEVATSSSGGTGADGDIAYRAAINFRTRNLTASLGYQDITRNFRADSAYLPNGTAPDNHGLDLQLNYRASDDFLFFQRPSISLQLYNQATESGEDINEYRGNIRFNMFKTVNFGIDYQYAESPLADRKGGSVRIGTPLWTGSNLSMRISFSDSGNYRTLSFYTDASFQILSYGSLRLSYQFNEQKEKNAEAMEDAEYLTEDSSINSSGHLLRLDASWKATHLLLQYRLTDKEDGEDNIYIRGDQSFILIDRFMFTIYAAYGDLSTLSSMEQFETGIEMRF